MVNKHDSILILGPTASGKTRLASNLAFEIKSEIISLDSRQVYRDMNIGTGKDLNEYRINNTNIQHHLIDICNAGDRYTLNEFIDDFHTAFSKLRNPILCGGTGLYIQTILSPNNYLQIPVNNPLRKELNHLSHEELRDHFESIASWYVGQPDLTTRKRTLRATEIAKHLETYKSIEFKKYSNINPIIIGMEIDREERRKRISERLKYRIQNGLIEEVEHLLVSGLTPEELIYYGLEYKYVTKLLIGKLFKHEMIEKLETEIHRFAKRQMTWFRKLEKDGYQIHWIDCNKPTSMQIDDIKLLLTP